MVVELYDVIQAGFYVCVCEELSLYVGPYEDLGVYYMCEAGFFVCVCAEVSLCVYL